MPAVCVKDVDQQEFVKAFAAFLKKSGKVKVPSCWPGQDCRLQGALPLWPGLVSFLQFHSLESNAKLLSIFYLNKFYGFYGSFKNFKKVKLKTSKILFSRYYIRCASLARHLYMRGNAGVGAFRKVYGGSKDNGFAPSHFRVANGNIIRKVSHSFEDFLSFS